MRVFPAQKTAMRFSAAISALVLAVFIAAGCNGPDGGDSAEPKDTRRPFSDYPLSENPPDSWTQFARNGSHDTFLGGHLAGINYAGELTKKPVFSNYNEMRGGIAIADGKLFIPDDTGRLLAIDTGTGATAWRSRQLDYGQKFSTPTYHRGLLFCGTEPGGVTCLNAETGSAIWHQPGSQGMRGVNNCPAVAAASILFSDKTGRFFRLDAISGRELWMQELVRTESADSDPVIEANTAVFLSRTGHIYGLNPDSGTVNWAAVLVMGIGSTPAAKNGIVYFTGLDTGLYGVDVRTGEFKLNFEMNAPSGMTPLVNGDLVVAADEENNLYCVNTATGQLEWKTVLATPSGSILVGFDNAILTIASINERIIDLEVQRARGRFDEFLKRKGPFLVITQADLEVASGDEGGGEVVPKPITNDELLALDRREIAMLWARRAEATIIGWDGEVREVLPLPTALTSAPAVYQGKMYAADIKGSIQVVELIIE